MSSFLMMMMIVVVVCGGYATEDLAVSKSSIATSFGYFFIIIIMAKLSTYSIPNCYYQYPSIYFFPTKFAIFFCATEKSIFPSKDDI